MRPLTVLVVAVAVLLAACAASRVACQTTRRSVANMTFSVVVNDSFNYTAVASAISDALNASNPSIKDSTDFPTVTAEGSGTMNAIAFFAAPSYKYGVRDLVDAVVSANASDAVFAQYGMRAVVAVEQDVVTPPTPPPDNTVMTNVGAALTALSIAGVIASVFVLYGKTLDSY
jgi:hypothetical protein